LRMSYVVLAVIGTGLGLSALWLHKSALGAHRVPPWAAVATAGAALALGFAGAWADGFAPMPVAVPPTPVFMPGAGPPLPGDYPAGPLAAGDLLQPLDALGWINVPPTPPGPAGPRATVLDLWASW